MSVSLRRAARDEQLQKRRAFSPDENDAPAEEGQPLPTPEEIVRELDNEDPQKLLVGTRAARRMLSRQHKPPIEAMIAAGVVPPLVKALDRDDLSEVQFEAAWALTNIASGSTQHTRAVVDAGAVPKLVSLLSLGGALGEQCAWALGNIAGDGAQLRDLVLSHMVLPTLLPMLVLGQNPSHTATAVWTLSNLCRNKDPMVDLDAVSPALPYIAELLTVDNTDILTDACWSLSYLTDGTNERIEVIQGTAKLLPRLVALLSHPAVSVQTPALRAVGNMVTGSDDQTDRVLEAGCLPHLVKLLNCNKSALVKEAAWCISNILAGSKMQIQQVIDAGVLPYLVNVVQNGDAKSQKEACWAVTNLCLGGSVLQLGALVEAGALAPFCQLLTSPDARTVLVVLEGIMNLLQAAEKFGEVEQLCIRLEEEGALDKLEALQQHDNGQIYKKTLSILDKYFGEGGDENTQPDQTDHEFKFGVADSHVGEF